MTPDIAETFGDNLKQLCRETIVHLDLAVRSDVDFDAGDDREAFRIAFNRGEQNVSSFFSRFQAPNETSQLGQFMIGQFEQLLHVAADGGVPSFQLLVERGKTELQSEVRLNDAVVNVVGDAAPFLFGGIAMTAVGRAARHVNGHVIMYADLVTDSMARAIESRWRSTYEMRRGSSTVPFER